MGPARARCIRPYARPRRVRVHWTAGPAAGPMRRMSDASKTYQALITELRELALLGSANSVLGWDEQTHMPPAGAGLRADQVSLLARMFHERFTSPRLGEWLAEVGSSG